MSESFRNGGIRKNPAIDKINSLSLIEVKNCAKERMERLLLAEESLQSEIYARQVPINFNKASWKGKTE